MSSICWRWWSFLAPTSFGLALYFFYIVLPSVTCGPQDAECLGRAWAIWIVGCYIVATVAAALRNLLRPSPGEPDPQGAADRAGGRLAHKSLLVIGRRSE